jgi:hypothetical protein
MDTFEDEWNASDTDEKNTNCVLDGIFFTKSKNLYF